MAKNKKCKPEDRLTPKMITMRAAQMKWLEELSEQSGISISELIRIMVDEEMVRQGAVASGD